MQKKLLGNRKRKKKIEKADRGRRCEQKKIKEGGKFGKGGKKKLNRTLGNSWLSGTS